MSITCRWAPVSHNDVAKVMLTLAWPCCGQRVVDAPTCVNHDKPVGTQAGAATKCGACENASPITVVARRELKEER